MALLMDFTDARGKTFPHSCWQLVEFRLTVLPGRFFLAFHAYASQEAYATGQPPLPGGTKSYLVDGEEFDVLIESLPQGETLVEAMTIAAEITALDRLDTPSGEVDAEGEPVLVSFFDAAEQV